MGRLLLELGPCLLLGLLLARRFPALPAALAPPLLHWGVPLSLVGLLLKAGFRQETLPAAGLSLVLCGGGLLLTRLLPGVQRLLPSRSLQLGAIVGNTAYFGLPAALALLPPQALGISITYDLVGTLVTWSLGPLLISGVPGQALLASPVLRAVLVAIPLQLSPWHGSILALLWGPTRLVIWLMLVLVGMRLAALLERSHEESPSAELSWALGIKLLVLPAAMLGLCAIAGVPGLVRDALVLQAAAPTAMSVLLLAEAAGGGEVIPAARLVLWSTLLALLGVPLWWWLLGWA